MIGPIAAFLLIFYAGAVAMNATAWLSVWRGVARFGTLRELTGIGDRAVLARLFGRADPAGNFKVSAAAILRHRRRTGIILSDLPVNSLFLVATIWAIAEGSASSIAIFAAGMIHLLVVAAAALLVLVGDRQVLLD